jgi:hypothetical protein
MDKSVLEKLEHQNGAFELGRVRDALKGKKKFSRVSAPVYLIYEMTIENFTGHFTESLFFIASSRLRAFCGKIV